MLNIAASPPTEDHSSTDATTPGPDHKQPGGSQTECQDAKCAFICPYCGKCTMEQFFTGEGCFKQVETGKEKKKVLFPYLDMSGLNEADRIDFEDRLQFETLEINSILQG